MDDTRPHGLPSRRAVLTATGSLAFALAGCLGRVAGLPGADADPLEERDCEEATRPEPALPGDAHEDAVEPAPYPGWPSSPTDETIAEYAEDYERAYRRNALVQRYDGRLVSHGLSVNEREVDDRPGDGAVVGLRYHYYDEIKREDEPPVHGDSPTIVVAYYVDGTVVLRAEATGHDADAPDPLDEGALLECP